MCRSKPSKLPHSEFIFFFKSRSLGLLGLIFLVFPSRLCSLAYVTPGTVFEATCGT